MSQQSPTTQQIATALRLVLGPGFESQEDEYNVSLRVMRALEHVVNGDLDAMRFAFASLLMKSEDNDAADLADEIGAAFGDALHARAAAAEGE